MFKSLSVLLPTLNETFSFVQTVKIILDECDHSDLCEFIAIVCDRTTPECRESIKEAERLAADQNIDFRILEQSRPYAGGALQDGFDAAKGSHLVMMSADLETDPHTIKDFITLAKEFPDDMITASRWLKGDSFAGYSKIKFVLNFLFQKFFAAFYGVKLTDLTFAYRLAPTELFKKINWEELKHPFFLETALKPICLGVKIHEIPSAWAARQEGESQNSLLQTFKYLRIAFKVKFETKGKLWK